MIVFWVTLLTGVTWEVLRRIRLELTEMKLVEVEYL